MTKAVVDLFEIVEIDGNCRQRLFAALEIVEQVAQRTERLEARLRQLKKQWAQNQPSGASEDKPG